MRKKKIAANIESLLDQIQNVYMDVQDQKSRIIGDFKRREKDFVSNIETLNEEDLYSRSQSRSLELLNQTIQKEIDILKIHKSLISMDTTKEEDDIENKPQELNSEVFRKIREEIKNNQNV